MPFVRIDMLGGRTPEAKAALVREVTEAVARNTGSDPGHIQVLLTEHEAGHWSLGGRMLSDVLKART
jgi:4-oxalocrotonate tautomerase